MFKNDDLVMARALQKLLQEGEFKLSGKDAPSFVKIIIWLSDLTKSIEEKIDVDKAKKTLELKPKKKKVNKVGNNKRQAAGPNGNKG